MAAVVSAPQFSDFGFAINKAAPKCFRVIPRPYELPREEHHHLENANDLALEPELPSQDEDQEKCERGNPGHGHNVGGSGTPRKDCP